MIESQFKFGDWTRMFVGEVPAEFYAELVVRCLFVYILLLVSMRLLGKRMSAQLNRNELSALVSLAAAIGVPIQAPDRGLLPAVVVALVIIGISRGLSMLIFYWPKAEITVQGNYAELIVDGVLRLKEMQMVRISRERILSLLRERGIYHLGEVRRLYFEAGATFTLVRQPKPGPGLPVIPDWDQDYLNRQQHDARHKACCRCGTLQAREQSGPCTECGAQQWTTALVS